MSSDKALEMLVIYRVKAGKESVFLPLLKNHWPTLNRVGLVTAEPAQVLRGEDKSGSLSYIEMFSWKDPQAPNIAHQTPEVMQIWEPMGPLVDGMEFIQVEKLP